jgi:hypothetical protein
MQIQQKMSQEQIAAARLEREKAMAIKTTHLNLAGKPLAEASDPAERVEIKLARLGRALEAFCFTTNNMHLLGMVRDALDDDDLDAVDRPDFDPEAPAVEAPAPAKRKRAKVS